MSRLESQAVAGFFPTPPRVVTALSHLLHAATPTDRRRVVRLLDPCAGTGEPVSALAQALGGESYGIEINDERAEACRARLDHLLATSAFSVRLANGAFSCLYLNPPYDYDDEKRRLEHAFLTSLSRALCPGGVLVFVIPQARLAVSARYLAAHYTGFRVYRFPDPEFAAFQQMVLLAVKKAQAIPDGEAQAQLESWSIRALPPLPDGPATPPLVAPALPRTDVLFAPLAFDPALAAQEARRRGVWVQPAFAEQLWPPAERPVRPLMPLRRGHLALLIAAGLLNNVVLQQGGRRVLVKGRTRKELVPVESDDENTEIQREVLRTSVVVLDLDSGAFDVVEQGDTAGPDAALRGAAA
ncbi:MAG: class I SAM-dependent methyltransferase [Chloroflexi bacterium]|nr:class I SAM-dependent methyltransferase [Chloroflexota bacterium]